MLKVTYGGPVARFLPPACAKPYAGASMDVHAHRRLAPALRALYEPLLKQPLPVQFVELLAQLDQRRQEQA